MMIIIIFSSLLCGSILSILVHRISKAVDGTDKDNFYIWIILCTIISFTISFKIYETPMLLVKALVLDSILIITAFIDLKHHLIPNKTVLFTLIMGVILIPIGDITLISAVWGMVIGGTILFLMALIPNALGGGDIKFMFALGIFLGFRRSLAALFFTFISAGIICAVLLLLNLKKRKEYIPFGPFIALGSFISYHFFI
jgi:leader peptidase (prepilin peptidase) / N-methyltransferase